MHLSKVDITTICRPMTFFCLKLNVIYGTEQLLFFLTLLSLIIDGIGKTESDCL